MDDEPQLIALVTRYLERLGYEVIRTETTGEAWARVEPDPGAFPLAIIDLTMPGLGGEELARRMLAAHRETRVLLTSGYAADVRALERDFPGRAAFLQKPFNGDRLGEALRRLGG